LAAAIAAKISGETPVMLSLQKFIGLPTPCPSRAHISYGTNGDFLGVLSRGMNDLAHRPFPANWSVDSAGIA
jgi:hypothetical protein